MSLGLVGRKVGMTSTDGVVIDERLVIRSDASGPKSARMVLQNPRVDFAVLGQDGMLLIYAEGGRTTPSVVWKLVWSPLTSRSRSPTSPTRRRGGGRDSRPSPSARPKPG